MPTPADPPLTVVQRRRGLRLAYWNAALWAIGNGLANSLLVIYLALEFEVPDIGLGIGLIVAAPHLAGVLRLAAPALIGRVGDRKRFCVAGYALSGLTLLALPAVVAPGRLPSPRAAVAALVILWCAYHLLEYLATVALWSWLADLAPQAVRGRFLGRRERWMAAGQAAAMLCGGLFVWGCHQGWPGMPLWLAPKWAGYAISATLGACFLIGAAAPLAQMPRIIESSTAGIPARCNRGAFALRSLVAPLADSRFLRLLLFGCWLSLVDGVTQSPQNVFPKRVLGLSLFTMLALRVGLRLGQVAVGPRLGRLVDRVGNRPVLAFCLLVVAQGPLFYFLATPEQPWWIAGAWAVWIAWVGINIGLPNLMLRLSPARSNAPHIATWFAATGLCFGLSTILGGALFDQYRDRALLWFGGATTDYYHVAFLLGWAGRSLGVLLLLLLVRPDRDNRPILPKWQASRC